MNLAEDLFEPGYFMSLITRFFSVPIRTGLTWKEEWQGDDQGLIACWEAGRKQRQSNPELAAKAEAGCLVTLPWKGGVDQKKPPKKAKYGHINYLAMWQGLRGEDLDVNFETEPELTCTNTGVSVVYTSIYAKYSGTDATESEPREAEEDFL